MPANFDRLRQRMDDFGLDAIVAGTKENVAYLTGVQSVPLDMFPYSGQSYVVVTRTNLEAPYFISSRCEIDQFLDADVKLSGASAYGDFYRYRPDSAILTEAEEQLFRASDVKPWFATSADALTAAFRELGIADGRVAVDADGVLPTSLRQVAGSLPGVVFQSDAAEHLRWTRRVKTQAEVDKIAHSAAVAEQGILAVTESMRTGATEIELVSTFNRTVAALGARPSFTLIKIGRNAVAGQTAPTSTQLQPGDSVWFDVGGVVGGYWYDIARVFSLGEGHERARTLYDAMLFGVRTAISEARAGMTGAELFDITCDAVRQSGVPHYQRSHVGHGIGVEVYDQVLIRPDCEDLIEEGTVVNIETPYYEYGLGAVHVEDPFVVRAGGNQILTNLDQAWGVVDL